MTQHDIVGIAKAHCALVFNETIEIRLCVQLVPEQWSLEVRALPYGTPYGMLISAEGEILEDALDLEEE